MTTKTEERVEYQLNPGYVEKWGGAEVLRELFANALDTGAEYGISFKLDKSLGRGMGIATISDQGHGFHREFLMLGGGEDKNDGQIGQFKEGLKLAMLVAARDKRRFTMRTTGFTIDRVTIEPGQLGKGLTAYLREPDILTVGTHVEVQVTQTEFNSAVKLFGALKATGHTVSTASLQDPYVQHIWKEVDESKQAIYINGLQVQKSDTMFSYNLAGDEVKQFQNRDRMIVDWQLLKWRASALLRDTTNSRIREVVISSMLSEDTSEHYSDIDALHSFGYSYTKDGWMESALAVLEDHHLRNKRADKLKVCVASPDSELNLVAAEAGFTLLPVNRYWRLLSTLFPLVHAALELHARSKEKKIEPVRVSDLLKHEKKLLEDVASTLRPFFGKKLPPIKVFLKSYINAEAVGYWYKGVVWIRRDQLQTEGIYGFRSVLETVLHELCHWRSGASDHTRDFERAIGELAADVIIATRNSKIEPISDEALEPNWIQELNAQSSVTFDEAISQCGLTRDKLIFTKEAERALKQVKNVVRATLVPSAWHTRNHKKLTRREREGFYLWSPTPRRRSKKYKYVAFHLRQSGEYMRKAGTYVVQAIVHSTTLSEWCTTYKPFSSREEKQVV